MKKDKLKKSALEENTKNENETKKELEKHNHKNDCDHCNEECSSHCDENCECESEHGEQIYNTENELNLKVTGINDQELINEDCCTCVNIIMQNDGRIQTSFLGAHNPEILNHLEKALKTYFKSLKKTLKARYFECSDDCNCEDCDKKENKKDE